jgi:signal transduction histidine kinase
LPDILVAGYSDSAFWLRLTVRPEPGDGPLVLRAWPTYVDELTLYTPDGAGGWTADVTGDRVTVADRSTQAVSLAFSIAPGAETTYYLRLKTTSTSMLGVEVLPHDGLFADDLRFGMVGAIVIGLMVAMLIWAGIEYVATREALMLWYIAAQAISVVYGLCLTGYMSVLLPWAHLDGLTSVFVWAATFSQILFYLYLMSEFDLPRGSTWLVAPLVIAELTVPLLFITGLWRIGLQVNAVGVVAAPLVITILAFVARGNAPPGRNVMRLAGLIHTGALVVGGLPVLGLIKPTILLWHGLLVHGALLGAIAFLILRARSSQVRRASVELGLARREFEVERREHDVRGRFLALLSHELKTPLSVIRLSLPAIPAEGPARGRVSGAIDSMTALIDLSTCAARLEQGQLPVAREPVPIAEVIGKIAAETAARGRLNLQGVALLQLRTDPQLLDVVVRNLLDNALKYSPPESAVDIVVRESEGGGPNGVIITVENLVGRGLPDPDKMFEKFYRGPGATSRAGLGLGLYVVRGIATLLGGTVNARLDGTRLRLEVWHPC